MEPICRIADRGGLSRAAMEEAVERSLHGRRLRHVLLIPPDFTRFHSNAGLLTNLYYHALRARGCQAEVLPALGSHAPMTPQERETMFGDIPPDRFLVHHWRTDVVRLGEVPAAFLSEITDGLWQEPVSVEINRRLLDPKYDLIISLGQVVPHEVAGMANHAKNLFVGVGGSDMIHKSHMLGAVYGMERMMGRDHTPVRALFDYALAHYLPSLPVLFVLTVGCAVDGAPCTQGLFLGEDRSVLEAAIRLSQEKNITFLPSGLSKCVVYLDPAEFRSTWLGNKAIYRTRMAMADGGELVILAPGIARFGEDDRVDRLIRKYGYRGREEILRRFRLPESADLRADMGAAAHLIHGSSDGRFRITYAVRDISQREIQDVGFQAADFRQAAEYYRLSDLRDGWQTTPEGEQFFFISNPALGLWIDRTRFSGGL